MSALRRAAVRPIYDGSNNRIGRHDYNRQDPMAMLMAGARDASMARLSRLSRSLKDPPSRPFRKPAGGGKSETFNPFSKLDPSQVRDRRTYGPARRWWVVDATRARKGA